MRQTFLVTGSDGFIGSAFVRALDKQDALFAGYDKQGGQDLANGAQLAQFAERMKPDWIVHLGATPGVSQSLDVSLDGPMHLRNVLNAMKASGCKNILFVSTGSVYCANDGESFQSKEDDATGPQTSYYAASKLACENILAAACAERDINAVVLRLGTIIGPGNRKGLIYDFIRKLRNNKDELEIWGNGQQIKSYVHIDDLISAMFAAMGDGLSGFRIYNVANHYAMSVAGVAQIVCSELGISPKIRATGGTQGTFGDVPRIQLSIEKLCKLGWEPRKSILDAIRENINWIVEHKEVLG